MTRRKIEVMFIIFPTQKNSQKYDEREREKYVLK